MLWGEYHNDPHNATAALIAKLSPLGVPWKKFAKEITYTHGFASFMQKCM